MITITYNVVTNVFYMYVAVEAVCGGGGSCDIAGF